MSATFRRQSYTINVRALADFCLSKGDLVSQYRASPSSLEGQVTHKLIQKKRPPPYQAEVPVTLTWSGELFDLKIAGRIDGIIEHGIEEIKTSRVPPIDIPESAKSVDQIQAMLYAGLFSTRHSDHETVEVRVCYVHPQTLQEWVESTYFNRHELIDFLIHSCAQYDEWLCHKYKHNIQLNPWLSDLSFPFTKMRDEQRLMAESVYKSSVKRRNLAIEAPTGTGKTLAALFPALKAMTNQPIDSIFYLSMKTTGQQAAWDSLSLVDNDTRLNAVQLSAKDNYCLSKDTPCDGNYCRFANNYFKKRTALRSHLFDATHWKAEVLSAFGEKHEICPYYLSQDWAIWSDIVIGDLNYLYDTTAVQPYLLKEIENRATVLIDEAHNLIERGRTIYSTNFEGSELETLRKLCPNDIKKALTKIQTVLRNDCKDKHLIIEHQPPSSLIKQVRNFLSDSASLLRESPNFEPPIEWQQFIFTCSRFVRLNELANEKDFVWRYSDGKPKQRKVEVICLNPSDLLEQKHNLVNNVVAFSATLKPSIYSLSLNGLKSAVFQSLPSPFAPQQHQVKIVGDVSTRYKDRSTLAVTLQPLLQFYSESKKNTWVFFSSYLQMHDCVKHLRLNESIHIVQEKNWSNDEKANHLLRFREERGLTLFCVLGGVFSEGVDLPGEQLEQVIIVGPGLPQVNDINNQIRDTLNQQGMPGFDYTYLYPGLQKVLQAAGRTVRTEKDIGEIVLIDDRFKDYQNKKLLPNYWQIQRMSINDWSAR
jgi:DNA excision repair protein ERCC-2